MGDGDDLSREARPPDKSKNQWQEPWPGFERMCLAVLSLRRHVLDFYSRSATRSTENPTTCEPKFREARWQKIVQIGLPWTRYTLYGLIGVHLSRSYLINGDAGHSVTGEAD